MTTTDVQMKYKRDTGENPEFGPACVYSRAYVEWLQEELIKAQEALIKLNAENFTCS
jgi:hypothetical protein